MRRALRPQRVNCDRRKGHNSVSSPPSRIWIRAKKTRRFARRTGAIVDAFEITHCLSFTGRCTTSISRTFNHSQLWHPP